MKQKISIVFILTVLVGSTYSQVDTGTVYKHLKTRKFYAVGLSIQTNGDQSKYEVNGKKSMNPRIANMKGLGRIWKIVALAFSNIMTKMIFYYERLYPVKLRCGFI